MRNGGKMGHILTWTIITALKSKKVTFCVQSRRSSLQLIYRVICTISKMDYDLGEKQIYVRTQNVSGMKHNRCAT